MLDQMFVIQVSTIMFFMTTDTNEKLTFGRSTATSQYLINLGDYHGIPMIAWNADNCGFDVRNISGVFVRACV